jgi:hypothetical protein
MKHVLDPFRFVLIAMAARVQHNAYESVTIHYRWHALAGKTLPVLRRIKQHQGDVFVCELSSGDAAYVPAWMTEPVCKRYGLGRPRISVQALAVLHQLLTTVRQDTQGDGAVKDNQPCQEEDYETHCTAGDDAVETAPHRPTIPGAAGTTRTGRSLERDADSSRASRSAEDELSTTGGSPCTHS